MSKELTEEEEWRKRIAEVEEAKPFKQAISRVTEELKKELVAHVRSDIGPIATPEVIQWSDFLPKTRSGKIMRRSLKKVAEGDFAP